MNKLGSVNIQGILIAIGMMSLFFGVIGGALLMMGGNYDDTGYDSSDIQKLNYMENISTIVNDAQQDVDKVTVEKIGTIFSVVYGAN